MSRGCLWRYELYGDFWEQLEIPLPDNAEGICALGDELFVVGGSVYDMQLEGAPADSDGAYNAGFYKADLARGAPGGTGGVSSGGMDPTVIGGVTIGLFAALVVVLSITRRKSRTGE